MMSQLRLNLRVNNQVTIGLQNCPKARPTVYKSLASIENGYTKDELLRFDRVQSELKKKRSPKYDWRGCLIVRRSNPKVRVSYASPKLDLIQKFQRNLRSFSHAGYVIFQCKILIGVLKHFSQYRLNAAREFGHVAGQRIREAGAAMEIAANRQMRFCHCTTLTLPGNTRESIECLAAYSSYVVNRLFQILRRKYKDVNSWFFCWEFQKRGALHLHIAHYHPDECEGMLIGNILIDQWHKILCDISDNSRICMFTAEQGDRCTIRRFHQHHTQPMVKSVAGYFAKYAGKAAKRPENDYFRKHAETLSPKRFWGSSFHLKAIVENNSYSSLFDVHSESEAEARYQEVLSVILEKNIVSFSRYEFKKEIEVEQTYGFKGAYRPKVYTMTIAEGFRESFYLSADDYQDIKEKLRAMDEYF